MLPVACYVASSTYRIFLALCNAGWVVVCVGGGILKEPFALASGHCKAASQLICNWSSRLTLEKKGRKTVFIK